MLKKFVSYYKPYKGLFAADMLCAFIVAAVDLAFPQILRYLTNNLFINNPSNLLELTLLAGAGLLIIYVIRLGCQYFITSWGHIMGARMEGDMRRDLFYHYQRLTFSYYDRNNTGEMISKLVNDLFDISELAHHGPENVILSILKIIGSFALLMTINVPITLILMAVTILMIVYSVIANLRMRNIFNENRKKIAGVNSRVQDSLLGIKVIKSFANEELEHRKFDDTNEQFNHVKALSYRSMGIFHSVNSFFQGLMYISALVSGAFFIASKDINAMDFALYFIYIGILLNPIEILINFTELFQRGFAGFKRFYDILETAPEIMDSKEAEPLSDIQGVIEFDNVSFSYDEDAQVLDNISFKAEKGKTIALVGPSGGGKTTICSLIPRFYDTKSGVIMIDGKDIRNFTLKSLRKAIGIVQQDVYIFNGSIKDNIAYGKPDATEEEIIEAARKANIHDFIASLTDGYETFVGERGTRLSGGQKQRLSIARVFLKDPKILILDEATSALDNESEKHIQKALEELSENRTAIVIAHRLSTIRNADKIFVIAEGIIKEQGSHRELMKQSGLYAKYYNMQFEGIDDLSAESK
jgi:ATP-binding cassette subfamily B protein